MKMFLSTIFGLSVLLIGACSNSNGVVQAEANFYLHGKVVAEHSGYEIKRFVDCETRVVLYTVSKESIHAVPFENISSDFTKKECGSGL